MSELDKLEQEIKQLIKVREYNNKIHEETVINYKNLINKIDEQIKTRLQKRKKLMKVGNVV